LYLDGSPIILVADVAVSDSKNKFSFVIDLQFFGIENALSLHESFTCAYALVVCPFLHLLLLLLPAELLLEFY
jgi:hypothetical protein